ncbi:hypothetical protein LptCag_1507 [Leptospirillum ferriphilum]|uniref:Transglycosylase SLT domain-containing protein n=1 Tax=Leptospirillum ferriphilum TaxID=178606 RepID=A0A094WDT2_9BACT|nr:transglycosylase SLT domain-containing protein [Leptospirillum ferriphilum]KGA93797.1 hypothetical protein LptCag_1507 [Leptospirillum ferriphilum]
MKIFIAKTAICLHLLGHGVPFHQSITHVACRHHINPVLIAAIIQTESNFRSSAIGNDPGGKSWGLMQIKYRTAKWLGFRGPRNKLLDPYENLSLGVRYLLFLFRRFPHGADAISAYNAGTPHWRGRYRNQHYVNSVLFHYKNFQRFSGKIPVMYNTRKISSRLTAFVQCMTCFETGFRQEGGR